MSRSNRLVPALAAPGLLLAALLGAWALQVSVPAVQAQQGVSTLKALQAEREAIAKALTPAVVAVADSRPEPGGQGTGLAMGRARACSGFVVDGDYVLTSLEAEQLMPDQPRRPQGSDVTPARAFMKPGDAVWMMAHDGTEFSGKVAGVDKRNLLMLVRMDPGHPALPSLRLGDSDKAVVGSTAMSLGNTLDCMLVDRTTSFSFGTVSGFYRFEPVDPLYPNHPDQIGDAYKGNVLEADVAVMPGDHGGPLLNLDGEVIGMMNAHFMTGRYLGCTVPSNQIRAVLPQLKKGVPESELARPYFVFGLEKPKDDSRVFIKSVAPGSPAAKAGLKVGQQLMRVDNFAIPDFERLKETLGTAAIKRVVTMVPAMFGRPQKVELWVSYGAPIGTHVQITVRDPESGKERTVDLVVGEKPEDF